MYIIPIHIYFLILSGTCLTSFLTKNSEPFWFLFCIVLWFNFTIVSLISRKIKNEKRQNLILILVSIGLIFFLYYLLSFIAFDVIPWNSDTFLMDISTLFGLINSPVIMISKLASPILVEIFSIIYLMFLPYVYLSILYNLFDKPTINNKIFILSITLTYSIGFLGYLLVPAKGPVISMIDQFSLPLEGGFFYHILINAIDDVGGPHGAFPSLHVAVSSCICFFELRYKNIRGLLYIPFIFAVFIATMLLRYHYLIDLIFGLWLGLFSVSLSERLYKVKRSRTTIKVKIYQFIINHFFSNYRVNGKKNISKDKPTIIVSNHVNAFVDPFMISAALGMPILTTAKAVLWEKPLTRILAIITNAIPLYRYQEEIYKNKSIKNVINKNLKSFKSCYDALDKMKIICIFPEGKSHSNIEMLPFKTGAARMALDYNKNYKNGSELQVVPVGINYEAKDTFGSRVLVEVGEPIIISNWVNKYSEPSYKLLNEDLRNKVRNLVPKIEKKDKFKLINWLSLLIESNNKNIKSVNISEGIAKSFVKNFSKFHQILYEENKIGLKDLKYLINKVLTIKTTTGIKPNETLIPLNFKNFLIFVIGELEIFFIGLPIFLIGLFSNIIPYSITFILVNKITKDKDHWATHYIFLGILVSLIYFFSIVLLSIFYEIKFIFLIPICIYSGYFSIRYFRRLNFSLHRLKTFLIMFNRPFIRHKYLKYKKYIYNEILNIKIVNTKNKQEGYLGINE